LTGLYEVMLFSETLVAARAALDSGQPLLISADARLENEDMVRLTGQSVELLDEAAAASSAGLRIFVESSTALAPLKQVLGREGHLGDAGRRGGRLRLVLPADRREVEIALPGLYEIGAQLRSAVKSIPGVIDLHDF
jgi:DNA polymerase-3 subunit alpha